MRSDLQSPPSNVVPLFSPKQPPPHKPPREPPPDWVIVLYAIIGVVVFLLLYAGVLMGMMAVLRWLAQLVW